MQTTHNDFKKDDDFDVIENIDFEEKNEQNDTNKDKFNYVISYIPPLFFLLLFTDVERNAKLDKHLKQSLVLFTLFIALVTFFSILGIWFLAKLVSLVYIGTFAYLAFAAYHSKYIELPSEKEIMGFFDKHLFDKMKK